MAKRLIGRRAQRARRKHPFSLTSREIEVLQWVARGKSPWEIGEILQIKKRTVHEHVQTAVRKMGAANRIHAVAMAIRDRIVEL
jgi:LuxR family quorum sensing-dependent transcriptional regulator